MEKLKFEQLIRRIEDQAYDVKFDFQIAELFDKMLLENLSTFTPQQKEKLEWERLLFQLVTNTAFATDGAAKKRFPSIAIRSDGTKLLDLESILNNLLIYFEYRSKKSSNPILRARYLDFLWEMSRSKKRHLYGLAAGEEYLLSVAAYTSNEAMFERLDALQRSAELALILEKKTAEKPLTQKVISDLEEIIDKTIESKNYRWTLEMFEIVVALSYFFETKKLNKFATQCENIAIYFKSDNNFHLQRGFINLKAKLLNSSKNNLGNIKALGEELAQSYLDEAEAKSESGLVRVHFLENAIEEYKKLDNKQKINELIEEIKKATKQALENQEFQQFSTTIEIKPEEWERMKNSLGINEQIPQNIGTQIAFLPRWSNAVRMTEEHSKKFVFMHLGTQVSYGESYPISSPKTPEQEFENHVMRNYAIEVELRNHWLTGCVNELIKERKFAISHFSDFLSKLETIDKETYDAVKIGLHSYFEDQHFHAIQIFATQLEDLLRKLLYLFGGQTTTLHIQSHAYTEKNLNRILIELKPFFPEELYRYIMWVLEDYRGYNLRYRVGHGFLKPKHANSTYSTALLHIYCLLIANTKMSVNQNAQ